MEEGKAFPYFLDIPLATRLTYCSMAGSSCSMHSTSFSCVRQRMRLWFGRETLKYKVEMPIVNAVDDILSGRLAARDALATMMGRQLKQE